MNATLPRLETFVPMYSVPGFVGSLDNRMDVLIVCTPSGVIMNVNGQLEEKKKEKEKREIKI